jgi:hypothetical protein
MSSTSYARGELRAVRSYALTAPNLFGTVQVTRLAPLGAFAREKDLIVEFDDSELLSRVEEAARNRPGRRAAQSRRPTLRSTVTGQ